MRQSSIQNYYLKQQLLEEFDCQCQSCGGQFDKEFLHLEHKIAIGLGGEQFNKDNCQILCVSCHASKTKIDVFNINRRKRLMEEG